MRLRRDYGYATVAFRVLVGRFTERKGNEKSGRNSNVDYVDIERNRRCRNDYKTSAYKRRRDFVCSDADYSNRNVRIFGGYRHRYLLEELDREQENRYDRARRIANTVFSRIAGILYLLSDDSEYGVPVVYDTQKKPKKNGNRYAYDGYEKHLPDDDVKE